MSSHKKFFLIFLFIILDMFLLVGFLVIRDATMLHELKKEVYVLSTMDIQRERFDRPLKSKGNYAIVEKTIKDYLDDYASFIQEDLSYILLDSRLSTILSYENYKTDGPEFSESLSFLKETRDSFNDKVNALIVNLDDDNIKNIIYEKTNDPYYQDLYNQLILQPSFENSFEETKDYLLNMKIKVNNTLDVSKDVLNFLIQNKDSWKLEEGEIRFLTQDLYNQYMGYISKLKN